LTKKPPKSAKDIILDIKFMVIDSIIDLEICKSAILKQKQNEPEYKFYKNPLYYFFD
jgi:hypothetical protein